MWLVVFWWRCALEDVVPAFAVSFEAPALLFVVVQQPADAVQHFAGFACFKAARDFSFKHGGDDPKLRFFVRDVFAIARVVGEGLRTVPVGKAVAVAMLLQECFRLFGDFAVFVFAAAVGGLFPAGR